MKFNKILILIVSVLLLVACSDDKKETSNSQSDFAIDNYGGETLRIVSGSENKELEPIIKKFAKKHKINISMDYLGSLDIMRMLQGSETDYDAVWPASSIWLDLGDTQNKLKHTATTSISPVVFGIRQSLAEELGFVNRDDVTIDDIMKAIESGKLKFAMTSATQSNSGASAYLGFLTALAGKQEQGFSGQELQDPNLQEKITTLLSGVNRSSGSSNWLVDLFVKSDYDAMVNYEALIIQANKKLENAGKEPLYVVYPKDGLSISDSPLAYIDQGNKDKEDAFLKFQEYLLSDQVQGEIESTGKRSAFGTVRKNNHKVFNADWGINLDQVLSPIRLPQAQTIMEALNLYQTQFKKPALTVYVLDYSGSMYGNGRDQMIKALEQVLVPENAKTNLLLGTAKDETYIIGFNNDIVAQEYASGNGDQLKRLYDEAAAIDANGGTSMYLAVSQALDLIYNEYGDRLNAYTPAIIVLSDGQANDSPGVMESTYQQYGMDIPIFSIMFGEAYEDELQSMADLSNGRIFDGRDNLIEAFQSVKGYN